MSISSCMQSLKRSPPPQLRDDDRARQFKSQISRSTMMPGVTCSVDPITRSVVQHRLTSIVTEMGEAMLRTSYSQILNSSRDFSIEICDTRARLIAQADHIPIHV